jgi:phosphoribosylformimino-5-aminoimidazole carboxamide ribotide isomerase
MRCILACDLKGGAVVRGVKGERHKYLPVSQESLVVSTSVPVEVIKEIRPKETYIADLDRIIGTGDNLNDIASISKLTKTMTDIGVKFKEDVIEAKKVSNSVIMGTETASFQLMKDFEGTNIIVSVDMKNGKMMWYDREFDTGPLEAIKKLNDLEIEAIILLDVGRVGSGQGIDTSLLSDAVSSSRHDVIIGGGVNDMSDLERIEKCGASGAIIASAIHFKKIPLSVLRG